MSYKTYHLQQLLLPLPLEHLNLYVVNNIPLTIADQRDWEQQQHSARAQLTQLIHFLVLKIEVEVFITTQGC